MMNWPRMGCLHDRSRAGLDGFLKGVGAACAAPGESWGDTRLTMETLNRHPKPG